MLLFHASTWLMESWISYVNEDLSSINFSENVRYCPVYILTISVKKHFVSNF